MDNNHGKIFQKIIYGNTCLIRIYMFIYKANNKSPKLTHKNFMYTY